MKLVLSFSLAALLLTPACAVAQTSAGTGFPCQNDLECVKIDNNCGGAVVNKESFDDFAPLAENMTCGTYTPSWPEDVARCYQGSCILVRLSEEEFRQEWYKCSDDDTCVVAYDGCQDFSVNAKYISEVTKEIKSKHVCKTTSKAHNPQLVGTCVKNMCTLATRN